MRVWRILPLVVLWSGHLAAQVTRTPTPTPTPHAPPPPDDVRMIRYKVSAGDLPSAESILEYHRAEKGEDADYLMGLAWVARGAALTGDWKAAAAWAASGRALAESKLKAPADYEASREAVYLLGTSIEVEAQALVASGKKAEAIRFLEETSRAQEKAPYNLRARIWKRRNLIELEGQAAPPLRAEEHVGAQPPSLESLRGKPVVLYFWWEACGDCRMQAAVFRQTVEKYLPKGVVFVAPTRYYSEDRGEEKQKIEKAWKETYALPESVSAPISDEAMLRYGISATPTFVFINRKGAVVRYSPTRMTEVRLAATIDDLLLAAQETPPDGGEAGLAGTSWQLVRFQGGDGRILTPGDGAKYTIKFGADGAMAARIDCNRGRGTWKSSGAGQLELGPLALTRVLCPPAPLNDRVVKDWTFVRSYVIKDGHLFLSLMADGGIYELEPVAGARPAPPKSTEVDIPHGR